MEARLKTLAAAAGVVISSLCLSGCEKLQQSSAEADRTATAQMREGKLEAAAKEKNASPILRSAASSQLAAQYYQQGAEAYGRALDRQLEVMRLGWRASEFAAVANENLDSARGIAGYDPSASLEKADQVIGDTRGASDKMTRNLESAQGVDLATITSLEATIEKLNHDIADVQKEIAGLEEQRQKVSQQAQELANRSADAKGQQSVELYKQSAEARKKATDLATQIEGAGNRLVPLQQNLAVASEQKEALLVAIQRMDKLKSQVAAGWDEIRKESAVRTANAESIAGKQPVKGQMTLLMSVKEMEGIGQELEGDYSKATSAYEKSASTAAEASAAAQQAYKRAGELATAYQGQPEGKIYKSVQSLLNTGGLRVNQIMAEYAAGRTYADWSGVLKIRQDAIGRLNEVSQLVKLPVPQELVASKVGAQERERLTKATAELTKSAADFEAVGGTASPETKRTAGVGRIASQLALAATAEQPAEAANAREAARTAAQDLLKDQPAEVKLPEIVQQAAAK